MSQAHPIIYAFFKPRYLDPVDTPSWHHGISTPKNPPSLHHVSVGVMQRLFPVATHRASITAHPRATHSQAPRQRAKSNQQDSTVFPSAAKATTVHALTSGKFTSFGPPNTITQSLLHHGTGPSPNSPTPTTLRFPHHPDHLVTPPTRLSLA